MPHASYLMTDMCANCNEEYGKHYGSHCRNGQSLFVLAATQLAAQPAALPPGAKVNYATSAQASLSNIYGFTMSGARHVWRVKAVSIGEAVRSLKTTEPRRDCIAYKLNATGVRDLMSDMEFFDEVTNLIQRGNYIGLTDAPAWQRLHMWVKHQNPVLSSAQRHAIDQAVTHLAGTASAPETQPIGPRKPPRTEIVQDWLVRETATHEGRQALMDRAWEATKALAKGA